MPELYQNVIAVIKGHAFIPNGLNCLKCDCLCYFWGNTVQNFGNFIMLICYEMSGSTNGKFEWSQDC